MNRTAAALVACALVLGTGTGCDHYQRGQDTYDTDQQSRRKAGKHRTKIRPTIRCEKVGHNPAGKPVCVRWSK